MVMRPAHRAVIGPEPRGATGSLDACFEIAREFVFDEPDRGGDERVGDDKGRRDAEREARQRCNIDELGCEGWRESAHPSEDNCGQGEAQRFRPNVERPPHSCG